MKSLTSIVPLLIIVLFTLYTCIREIVAFNVGTLTPISSSSKCHDETFCSDGMLVLFDSTNSLHRDIRYHPEQPARIESCVKRLYYLFTENEGNNGMASKLQMIDVAPVPCENFMSMLTKNNARLENGGDSNVTDHILRKPFTEEELNHARSILVRTHTDEFVSKLESACRRAKERRMEEGKNALGFCGYIDADTFLTTETYDVCLRAAATWIRSVDISLGNVAATANQEKRVASFALTRPPGHHATKLTSNGFCIFNFAAAAAIHCIESGLVQKVSIIDWDVHYGQGVADIVQEYPSIRYASMHQCPAFPYEGEKREVTGKHKNILTIPLPADSTWTCGYKQIFEELVLPFAIHEGDDYRISREGPQDNLLNQRLSTSHQSSPWVPDLVIVCAGFDALISDELANCNLDAQDYGKMARMLRKRLESSSCLKTNLKAKSIGLMFGLEGGYQLEDSVTGGNLADAVLETIKAFC